MKRIVNSAVTQRFELFKSVKCYKEFSQEIFRELAVKTQLITLRPGDNLFSQAGQAIALFP